MLGPPNRTVIWMLRKDGHVMACVARLMTGAIEFRIERDGRPESGRVLQDQDELLAWAEDARREFVAEGWRHADAAPTGDRQH